LQRDEVDLQHALVVKEERREVDSGFICLAAIVAVVPLLYQYTLSLD